ncbi:MAG: DUF3846 domain-containing protein [Candidatus Methanomethylophilaceae archaeon]
MTDNTKERNLIAYAVHENGDHGPVNVKDDLTALQESVGGYIDIVTRHIGAKGRPYIIVCDDEGCLRGRKTTAVFEGKRALVGDLLILRKGRNGKLDSLTDDDINYVSDSMLKIYSYTDREVVGHALELV